MPELPEVEARRAYLDATALRQTIERARVHDKRLVQEVTPRQLQARLKGARPLSTDRHGKHLFARLSTREWLVFHFRMTGDLVYYEKAEKKPENGGVTLDFDTGSHLAYVSKRILGHVAWTPDREAYVRERGLGPDALARAFTLARFRERLAGRTAKVKSALMDQALIAGIGNVWADEILF